MVKIYLCFLSEWSVIIAQRVTQLSALGLAVKAQLHNQNKVLKSLSIATLPKLTLLHFKQVGDGDFIWYYTLYVADNRALGLPRLVD